MEEVLIKTHLIVMDVHEEYHMNWCGKLIDTKPRLNAGMPIFVVRGTEGRMEINTLDMARLEKCAKLLSHPKGRKAITSDSSYIYIVEEDGTEKLMGILTHDHVKTFAPMFDAVGYK